MKRTVSVAADLSSTPDATIARTDTSRPLRTLHPRSVDHPNVSPSEATLEQMVGAPDSLFNPRNGAFNADTGALVRAHIRVPSLWMAAKSLNRGGTWCTMECGFDNYDWSNPTSYSLPSPLAFVPFVDGCIMAAIGGILRPFSRRTNSFAINGARYDLTNVNHWVQMAPSPHGLLISKHMDRSHHLWFMDERRVARFVCKTPVFRYPNGARVIAKHSDVGQDLAYDRSSERFVIMGNADMDNPYAFSCDIHTTQSEPLPISNEEVIGVTSFLGRPTYICDDVFDHLVTRQLDSRASFSWISLATLCIGKDGMVDCGVLPWHLTAIDSNGEMMVISRFEGSQEAWIYSASADRWRREPRFDPPVESTLLTTSWMVDE